MFQFATRPTRGEDRHIAYTLKDGSHASYHVMVVIDGHGGCDAADVVSKVFRDTFDSRVADRTANMRHVLLEVFDVLQMNVEAHNSGCAMAVCIVVDNRELWCANVGDVQVMYADHDGYTMLSTSHRLSESPSERAKVLRNGGIISRLDGPSGHRGPLRMWPGGLQMSRSLGDVDCRPMISHVPAVYNEHVQSDKFAIIVASDGVWDAIDADKVWRTTVKPSNTQTAEKIASLAWKRRQNDDVTCVVYANGVGDEKTTFLSRVWHSSSSLSSSPDEDDSRSSSPERLRLSVPL